MYSISHFSIIHDHFTVNKIIIRDFCDKLISLNKPYTWECSSRADALDEEIILRMKKAGCKRLFFGIETGSPAMQKVIKKNLNLDYAREIISIVNKNKIRLKLSFIYGFPEESEEDLKQTLEFIQKSVTSGVNDVSISRFTVLSDSDYFKIYKDKLVLRDIDPSWGDDFNLAGTHDLIISHPEIFPNFFTLPNQLADKYQYLDQFITSFSFLYKYFPSTYETLLNLFERDLCKFYHRFTELLPDFGPAFSNVFKTFDTCSWMQLVTAQLFFLNRFIQALNTGDCPEDLSNTFAFEKSLLRIRAKIPAETIL